MTIDLDFDDLPTDRAEIVSAILELAYVLGQKYNVGEAVGALHIALAVAERGICLGRGQSNGVLSRIRDSVDEAARRLGPDATAREIVLELAVIG